MVSANNNKYTNFEGDVFNVTSAEFDEHFIELREAVQGRLSGPPGIEPGLRQSIQNFLVDYAEFRANVHDTLEMGDIIGRYNYQSQTAKGWLDTDSNIKADQRNTIRQMKSAMTAQAAAAPRLNQLVPTTNEKLVGPGFQSQERALEA